MSESALHDRIVAALRTVHDPEIPVNIYDLGLIYALDVSPAGEVAIRMTLTSPACPVAGALPAAVEQAVRGVEGVAAARAELVWDPPWTRDRMSAAARLRLNLDPADSERSKRPGFLPLDSFGRPRR